MRKRTEWQDCRCFSPCQAAGLACLSALATSVIQAPTDTTWEEWSTEEDETMCSPLKRAPSLLPT